MTVAKLLKQDDFLVKHRISGDEFLASGLVWKDLEAIFREFSSNSAQFERVAEYVLNELRKVPGVHSVRSRVKSPEHLIEKIIRKKIEDPTRDITDSNYRSQITDLVGVRALHLFKSDWMLIHKYIVNTWNLKEMPVQYYRKGDVIEDIETIGCESKEHKFGYRSVHYILESKPTKDTFFVEVQVRTIFEEGWSEIDHTIRYPNFSDDPLYNRFLLILNRLAGGADEMGSFIQFLQADILRRSKDFDNKISERDTKISELEAKIQRLKVEPSERESLKEISKSLADLKAFPTLSPLLALTAGLAAMNTIGLSEEVIKNLTRNNSLLKSVTWSIPKK